MRVIDSKNYIYSAFIETPAIMKSISETELNPFELKCLVGGEYITTDNYGFSKSQLTKLLKEKGNRVVQRAVNKLEKYHYLKKVREMGGTYRHRFSALYALTVHGDSMLSKYRHHYNMLLRSADSFNFEG